MIIRLPHCFPVIVTGSTMHWHRDGTHHGPKSNPRFLAFSFVRLGTEKPGGGRDFGGRRLWIYVRGGYALHVDVYVDRRPVKHVRRSASWLFWKFVHNALVHPCLSLPWEPRWAQRAHDWTALRCKGGG